MTAPDVYLVAAAAAVADLNSTMKPEFIASRTWFIAAIDAAVRSTQQVGCDVCTDDQVSPRAIDIHTPVVLKQAVLIP